MAWAGSDIFYIIDEEMLCPDDKPGDRRARGPFSRYMNGLSGFDLEDQAGLTVMEYVRGRHRLFVKKSC